MRLITSTDQLAAACERLAGHPYVAVDTEFMRETTYWPKLCLIQLAGPDHHALVDPLAKDIDLAPFFALLADERVTKVFHAARQDIEIFWIKARQIPTPIFDTQVAAMVCGFGDSVSYVNLVKKLLSEEVDKSSRFTDWSRRPLSDRQLAYALGDVTHLCGVYQRLAKELDRSGRAHWLEAEMGLLTDPATYESSPEEAWRRVKVRVKSRRAQAILMELALWRERLAQTADVPRNRIMRDDALGDIANHAPDSPGSLGELRSVSAGFARSERAKEVIEAVQRGRKRSLDTVPHLERGEALPAGAAATADLLRVLLKACAAKHGVAPKVLATTEELEAIAVDDNADVPALKGWRRELFGKDALELKHGRLALAVEKGEVKVVPAG
ncbi:MAG: ribonuclease D [Hyphomicrobiaceae bacterium]|nr:MAG: ribonuclease D [Hyphomicrobiaceae bacterium]